MLNKEIKITIELRMKMKRRWMRRPIRKRMIVRSKQTIFNFSVIYYF